MRKFFLLMGFSAFLAISFFQTSITQAQTSTMVAEHFVKEGHFYYEQGEYQLAIDAFSKALLSDPDNGEAREFLHKMGISGGIYSGRNASLNEIARLTQGLVELKAQNVLAAQKTETLHQTVDDLQGQKTVLENQLGQKNKELDQQKKEIVQLNVDLFQMKHTLNARLSDVQEQTHELDQIETKLVSIAEESPAADTASLEQSKDRDERVIESLQKKLTMIKEEAVSDSEKQKARIEDLEEELTRKKIHLTMVNDKLILAKRMIKERYIQLSRKDEAVEALKRSLNQMKNVLVQAKLKFMALEQNKTQLTSANEERADVLKKQEVFIMELKDTLAETKRELVHLKEKFQGPPDSKDTELQAQLEETMSQLEETQVSLKDKNEEYAILQKRFEDTTERLDLVESLMQDKETQVENLEKDLNAFLENSGEIR